MSARLLHGLLEVAESDEREFRQRAEALLREQTGSDAAHLVGFDEHFSETAPDYLRTFTAEPRYSRPILRLLYERRERSAYIDTELLSAKQRDGLALYAEVLKPLQMRSQLVHLLRFRDETVGVLHCNRIGASGALFGARELEATRAPAALLAALLVARRQARSAAPAVDLGLLSPREAEVAGYAARGYENIQIAAHLGRSLNTVRNQLHSAFRKLGVYSRVDLANVVLGRQQARPSDPMIGLVHATLAEIDLA